jgi:CheY-like chemotaxis protein
VKYSSVTSASRLATVASQQLFILISGAQVMCCLLIAVTTSINGMSALEELRQHPNHYDLVLSDVYMPGGGMAAL